MYYRNKGEQAERLAEAMIELIERHNMYKAEGNEKSRKAIVNQLLGLQMGFHALDIPVSTGHDEDGYIFELYVMGEKVVIPVVEEEAQ